MATISWFDNVLFDELESVTFRGIYNSKYDYKGKIEIRRGALDGELLGERNLSYFDEEKQSAKDTNIRMKSGNAFDKLFVIFKNTNDPERFITNPDYLILNYKN